MKWPQMSPQEAEQDLRQRAVTTFGAQTPAIQALAPLLAPDVPDAFETIPLSTVSIEYVLDSSTSVDSYGLPGGLQGIWFAPDHPTFGPSMWRFGFSKSFHGYVINIHGEQHFKFNNIVTANYSHPGAVIVADTPRSRRWLQFFHKYGLEYGFPLFTHDKVGAIESGRKVHTDTWVLNSMKKPFSQFLLPSAYLEGFSVEDFMHAGYNGTIWDPLLSDDVVMCSCSLHMFPDRIERRQFGRFAYNLVRIKDDKETTSWFRRYRETLSNTAFVHIQA